MIYLKVLIQAVSTFKSHHQKQPNFLILIHLMLFLKIFHKTQARLRQATNKVTIHLKHFKILIFRKLIKINEKSKQFENQL